MRLDYILSFYPIYEICQDGRGRREEGGMSEGKGSPLLSSPQIFFNWNKHGTGEIDLGI